MNITIRDPRWYSDWNGDEVGFANVPVVGLYGSDRLGADFYVDTESGEVLAIMLREEDE